MNAVDAIKERVDHDYSMQFTPSYYLLRDLCRIIGEKNPEEQWGISFGAEDFIHLHDKAAKGDLALYASHYAREYPQAVYYFWDGKELQSMERQPFFSKLHQVL